jgi:hypothetical protein
MRLSRIAEHHVSMLLRDRVCCSLFPALHITIDHGEQTRSLSNDISATFLANPDFVSLLRWHIPTRADT